MTTIIQQMHQDRSAARASHKIGMGLNPGPGQKGLDNVLGIYILAENSESLFTLGFTPVDRPTTVVTTIIQEMHRDRSAARGSHKT